MTQSVDVVDGLTLWLAITKEVAAHCMSVGCVPLERAGNGRSYIGLRERYFEALERAQWNSSTEIGSHSHVLLRVHLTPLGMAHYTTKDAGPGHRFTPILTKMVYTEGTYDWKVWHFLAHLPLRAEATRTGDSLVQTEWYGIQ